MMKSSKKTNRYAKYKVSLPKGLPDTPCATYALLSSVVLVASKIAMFPPSSAVRLHVQRASKICLRLQGRISRGFGYRTPHKALALRMALRTTSLTAPTDKGKDSTPNFAAGKFQSSHDVPVILRP
jgi:hypothetical protein